MNIGAISCGSMSIIFLLCFLLFAVLRERAAILISGFNTMPKAERERYDKEKMSRDQRNMFALWTAVLGSGAVLSYFVSQYAAILAFVIWLIVFFKDVHLDEKKAFEKYKIR